MHNIWSKRFNHYVKELQKYTRYIFTGHIAVVLVFVLGALGFQYSEWLKVVQSDFPAQWLVAILVGIVIAFSHPTTLLREPDQVYLLPLESKVRQYFQKALSWTFYSQVLLPTVLYIISIPLLRAVTELTIQQIWIGAAFVVALKFVNVSIEFNYRYANRGQVVLLDRLVRIILNILVLEGYLHGGLGEGMLYALLIIAYHLMIRKKVYVDPVPYEHFISIEQNRMMRFYRFANLFTDVPHLRGAVKRRQWLDFVMNWIPFKKGQAQRYLVARTFIRTDDLFYLWVRLTAIGGLFAAFISIQPVTWILSAALVFATVIQLKQALVSKGEFRMDMLYPGVVNEREYAVNKLIMKLVIIQAIIVMLCNIKMDLFFVTPLIIIIVGFFSIKFTSN
jgi:ABC-2 type transport system permease protein